MAEELKKITEEGLKAVLEAHKLWLESLGEKGKKANLSNTDLIGANLYKANLEKATLYRADFLKANLERANLEEADLKGATLERANLVGANLLEANLEEAFLAGANLTEANLKGANLKKVNLNRAILFFTNLRQANLERAHLNGAAFDGAILNGTILNGAFLKEATFSGANLFGARFEGANLEGANLDNALYRNSMLEKALNVNPKYLTKKDIILDTESQKKSLEEEKIALEEKLKKASSATQEEKEKSKQVEKRLEQVEAQLEKAEQTIQREQEAKKKTTTQIETAVKYLKNPNNYIPEQIKIQYILAIAYGIFSIIIISFFIYYVSKHYSSFKDGLSPETTFINWLFYASPLLISFSLIIISINQINSRLQNIVRLHERKRYVDSVDGGLQAINALSINNEEARIKILETMDKIIDNTIQSSEKANEPITLDEKSIEDPLTTLSKIKGLIK